MCLCFITYRSLTPSISLTRSVMSVVQEDDEEKTVIHLSSPLPSKQTTPPPPLPPVSQEPPPESSSSSSSSSSEESSSSSSVTVTETETPARHISEGELLLTHGQMAAVRGTRSVQHTLTQPD